MRKAILVESNRLESLNDYLEKDWEVENMQPFSGTSCGQFSTHYTEPILVILWKK